MGPIFRKFNDGRTDGQMGRMTGGQMDESGFIGRCLTKVERPKLYFGKKISYTSLHNFSGNKDFQYSHNKLC